MHLQDEASKIVVVSQYTILVTYRVAIQMAVRVDCSQRLISGCRFYLGQSRS